MTKTFCDNCGREITPENNAQLLFADFVCETPFGSRRTRVHPRMESPSGGYLDLCSFCVIEALSRKVSPPRSVPEDEET